MPRTVVLAQLHDRKGLIAGARMSEPHRSHGAERKRHRTAARDLFDGHAALEIDLLFERMRRDLFRRHNGADKGLVLISVERTVDVILAAFAPARGHVSDVHVDRRGRHDWGDGVVEVEVARAHDSIQLFAERSAGEWTGRDYRWSRRQRSRFLPHDLDQRMRRKGFGE